MIAGKLSSFSRMSEKPAFVSVQQSLRKSFDAIEPLHEEWNNTLLECNPHLTSLSNLAEQLQACQRVLFKKTPLSSFINLQEHLRFKLQAAMEFNLEILNQKLSTLQRIRDSVSQVVGSVLYMYETSIEKIGLEAILERSSLCPSIADMLEWLQDIEKHYRNQYLQRKLLLQVCGGHLSDIQALPQSWAKLRDAASSKQQHVEDILLSVSFFRMST
ncbi:hypothetical protein XENTR_v10005922 [Xenopus tropicalis]|uniref:Uncharacterized protein C1orf109 homolog isoform X2 n=1 Tax=Xenopus tropicalis TaxID=8364 RepID=A0A8J0SFY2_XENTR|nr:uncharacterized protein C1orf109 homolog isoform X2 [Xenopus tropicalis]KAE8624336.1 hypothetical protein XENTR_v10005922 [Xenopus tropicalis]|eukprot:XP_012812578.1 PREDICTED: uncharacterized protein C1orf109 homolog isoform X2 [Xenopus tropicalis]